MADELKPVQAEVKNLLSMFDFFLSQRKLGKPIESQSEAVKDMRLIIGRLLVDHLLTLTFEEGERFCKALAAMLTDCCENVPQDDTFDNKYCNYCVGEILTAFEFAMEIKKEFDDDAVLQKMLALDIPILRPFDYGMRGTFKVIESQKRRRIHK